MGGFEGKIECPKVCSPLARSGRRMAMDRWSTYRSTAEQSWIRVRVRVHLCTAEQSWIRVRVRVHLCTAEQSWIRVRVRVHL